jgi:hypothetical protein
MVDAALTVSRFTLAKALLAREISRITRYCDSVIQCSRLPHDSGEVLAQLHAPRKQDLLPGEALLDFSKDSSRTALLIDGTLNHHLDIQSLLMGLKSKLNRHSRILVVLYNPYLRFLYRWASALKLRKGEVPSTFVTETDLENLAKLSGFEVVRKRPCVYLPYSWMGIGTTFNTFFSAIPILRKLALTYVITLRPVIREKSPPSITIVIPTRNERGNIENALKRMPSFPWAGQTAKVEIIFVEGHSTDGTWEEIQRVQKTWADRFSIKSFQQTGKGKADAVRLGFSHATCELLTILDADLTMPPEDLIKFYNAYCQGQADFINGSRLVYPMEGEAMRFLNWLGNIFFAKALSWVLDTRLSDSLCGTKLMTRKDYDRFVAWRRDFGDFDPFGDFEMIFPACILGLGVVDIPIYYRARTYGSTSIQRFRHGLMLLRMTSIGFFKVKAGV